MLEARASCCSTSSQCHDVHESSGESPDGTELQPTASPTPERPRQVTFCCVAASLQHVSSRTEGFDAASPSCGPSLSCNATLHDCGGLQPFFPLEKFSKKHIKRKCRRALTLNYILVELTLLPQGALHCSFPPTSLTQRPHIAQCPLLQNTPQCPTRRSQHHPLLARAPHWCHRRGTSPPPSTLCEAGGRATRGIDTVTETQAFFGWFSVFFSLLVPSNTCRTT